MGGEVGSKDVWDLDFCIFTSLVLFNLFFIFILFGEETFRLYIKSWTLKKMFLFSTVLP